MDTDRGLKRKSISPEITPPAWYIPPEFRQEDSESQVKRSRIQEDSAESQVKRSRIQEDSQSQVEQLLSCAPPPPRPRPPGIGDKVTCFGEVGFISGFSKAVDKSGKEESDLVAIRVEKSGKLLWSPMTNIRHAWESKDLEEDVPHHKVEWLVQVFKLYKTSQVTNPSLAAKYPNLGEDIIRGLKQVGALPQEYNYTGDHIDRLIRRG